MFSTFGRRAVVSTVVSCGTSGIVARCEGKPVGGFDLDSMKDMAPVLAT